MTGAGVELLVEPWELGIRKAKEFLLAAEELDAAEAWRLGPREQGRAPRRAHGAHHGAGRSASPWSRP